MIRSPVHDASAFLDGTADPPKAGGLPPLDLADLLDTILAELRTVFPGASGTVALSIPGSDGLFLKTAPERFATPRSGRPGGVGRSPEQPREIALPLETHGRVIGTLTVAPPGPGAFGAEAVARLKAFARLAALAVHGALRDRTLTSLSLTDELTGLGNRRALEQALRRELARASRSGKPLSVLWLDLDDFKELNDRFGHQWGDAALRAVARVLQRCCRASDVACRVGGDEFVVVLPGVNRLEAERVVRRISRGLGGSGRRLAASHGVATYPVDGVTAHELLGAADRAMYRAKPSTRGRAGWRGLAALLARRAVSPRCSRLSFATPEPG